MSNKNSNSLFLTPIRARVNSVDEVLSKAFDAVSKRPMLASELQVLIEMGTKLAGLKNCEDEQLESGGEEVMPVLQSIENYCEFMLSVATNGNSVR